MKTSILLLIFTTVFSVTTRAQTVSNVMTPEDIQNTVSLLTENANIGRSGFQRPFGERQLQLLKLAVFENPNFIQFKSIHDATQVPALQSSVDSGAEKLFSNRLFANSFCHFASDAEMASWNFGVSPEASTRIAQTCNRALKPKQLAQSQSNRRHNLLKSGRKVVFLELESAPRIESWTSMNGDLHIFHNGQIGEFELTRALLHEYYVAFDHYWMFSSITAEQYLDGTGFRARDTSKVKHYFDLFAIALFRGSFLMARAFEFEERVLSDLYQQPRTRQTMGCWEKIKALATNLEDQQFLFLGQAFFFLPANERLTISRQQITMAQFDQLIGLEKIVGANKSLCPMLSEPSISMVSTFYTSGPRPRIGSGTELKKPTTLPTSEELARKLTPQTLQEAPPRTPTLDLNTSVEKLKQQWPTSLGDPTQRTQSNTIYFNSLTGTSR